MSKERKILNIDDFLANPSGNMVEKVGVELEGLWKKVPDGVKLEGDASVFRGNRPPGYQAGEIPIGPVDVAILPKFLKKYYPSKIDATCGMHVHMSFKTGWRYRALMEPDFQDTIIEYLTRWAKDEGFPESHHIWPRLRGENEYCQYKFWPDEQAQSPKDYDHHRKGHRYTIINYCGRYNTIECRVLPMMDTVEQAARAIKRVINITNGSLLILGKRRGDVKVSGRLELPGGEVYEEFLEAEIPLSITQRKTLNDYL